MLTTDDLYFDWLSWAGVEATRVYLSSGSGRAYPVLQPAGSILVPGELGFGSRLGGKVPPLAKQQRCVSLSSRWAPGPTLCCSRQGASWCQVRANAAAGAGEEAALHAKYNIDKK